MKIPVSIVFLAGLLFLVSVSAQYSNYHDNNYPGSAQNSNSNYNCNNCFRMRNLCRNNFLPFWFCHETHSSCYYRFCYNYNARRPSWPVKHGSF